MKVLISSYLDILMQIFHSLCLYVSSLYKKYLNSHYPRLQIIPAWQLGHLPCWWIPANALANIYQFIWSVTDSVGGTESSFLGCPHSLENWWFMFCQIKHSGKKNSFHFAVQKIKMHFYFFCIYTYSYFLRAGRRDLHSHAQHLDVRAPIHKEYK